jgi:dTDP-4-dehydrorhamnose 3,5-epimerase-like enzyme
MIKLKRVGKLTQAAEELPFTPKRVYWIDTKGEARGGHAHYETEQVFTCVQGSYTFVVDDGLEVRRYKLSADHPEGVYISCEWHTMEECSPDCIIMVMASHFCDEKDYIRDFNIWKGWIDERINSHYANI